MPTQRAGYCSFAYSALACFRMRMSGSAIFPEGEEVSVCGFRLGGVAGLGVGWSELEMSKRTDGSFTTTPGSQ
jgi:hypothetical protein